MAITRTAWIDDDGTGTTGTVINNAEKQLLYDQIDAALVALAPSAWVKPAFSAANFLAQQGGPWTVEAADVRAYKYRLSGTTISVVVDLITTTVGAGVTNLQIRVPGGSPLAFQTGLAYAAPSATGVASVVTYQVIDEFIYLASGLTSGAPWVADTWSIYGVCFTAEVK